MRFLMGDIIDESLYKKQNMQFERTNETAKAFAANYCGNTIIRDSIFGIASNYARKRELPWKYSDIHLKMMNFGLLHS